MDFTKFDIIVLLTMSLSVIVMSFLFPALGITDQSNEANESDIPEFNISSSNWDIAGDFPNQPGTPTEGNLIYDETNGPVPGQSIIWIDRPKSSGTSLEIQNLTNTEGEVYVTVIDWDDTSANGRQALDRYSLNNSEGEIIIHDNTTWTIEFDVQSVENYKQPDMGINVRYEILESEEDEGGIAGIPVIGTLYSAGAQLAGMLAYLGSIIMWFTATVIEMGLTTVETTLTVVVYVVGISQWMIGTYSSIVSGAGTWASVILVAPTVLLMAEFAKLAMLTIKLLPFT